MWLECQDAIKPTIKPDVVKEGSEGATGIRINDDEDRAIGVYLGSHIETNGLVECRSDR